ncbi:MAG: hypothetical protein DRJ40_02975 [Thermoprotei archaeon]|nr:MAG: hypothetical protein DRJ40_02975 [Thermoprotei archaeon]
MRLTLIKMWQPDCPVISISEKFDNIGVYVIDSRVIDEERLYVQMVVLHRNRDIHEIIDTFKKLNVKKVGVLWRSKDTSALELVCKPTHAIKCIWDKPLAILRPLFTQEGLEDWFLLSVNSKQEAEILSTLKEYNDVKICKSTRVRPEDIVMLAKLMNPFLLLDLTSIVNEYALTKTQNKVLLTAISKGYYEYPRKVNLTELASMLKVSKSAIAKDLRRAEKKILNIAINLLKYLLPTS